MIRCVNILKSGARCSRFSPVKGGMCPICKKRKKPGPQPKRLYPARAMLEQEIKWAMAAVVTEARLLRSLSPRLDIVLSDLDKKLMYASFVENRIAERKGIK